MKVFLTLILCAALAGCGNTTPTGSSSLMCVSIEAAALVKWFSTTTLVEGVIGPTDVNGEPLMTSEELAAAMDTCFSDPQSQVLMEALRQLNAVPQVDG